jgi:peptide/nickel transport system substrate-binding protein
MTELTRREVLKGAAALGTAGALTHAAGPSATAQTTQKRELIVAQGGDVAKFDPHFSTSSNEIRVSFNIFDNLVARHPDGKLHPALATEWKLQGPTTWTFKLRQGVKWHNGDPFSSADAKFSIERTFCCPPASRSTADRSSPRSIWSRSAPTSSTTSPWGPVP